MIEKTVALNEKLNRTSNQSQRLMWLDILKGIGIILVAIGHIYKNDVVFDWVYSFHMPLFFFAAGWLYKKKDIWVDIKRRFVTIVIPYFSFGFLVFLYWALLERRFRESTMGVVNSLIGLLRGQYDYLDFNVHLWFLPCFFVTVVLYNILMNLGGKKLALSISVLMSAVFVVFSLPGLPWGLDRVFKYIGFYAVGNIIAEKKAEQIVAKYSNGVKLAGAIVLLGINFGFAYLSVDTGITWFVTGIIGVAGCVLASMAINYNKVFQHFGSISLIILCIHGPVYRVIIKIVSVPLHMSTEAVRESAVLALLAVVMTLAVCCVAYEIVLRFTPWMLGKQKRTS